MNIPSVQISHDFDLQGIAIAAGSTGKDQVFYVDGRLYVKDVSQAALEASVSAYDQLAHIRKIKIEQVKIERDRKRFEGGVKVGNLWFLTTLEAVSQYCVLELRSIGVPSNTVLRAAWRSMSGAIIDMTPALVSQILQAGIAQAAAIDDAATAHKVAIQSSNNPAAYDFSTGWPEIFEDQA